jgi:branched-chain amino acid transport system permease protein
MVEALGYNVPRIWTLVFSVGAALAGLAGVIGGSTFLTEPNMAITLGPIIFVVVVIGGMGSLQGAFLASLLIGLVQTFAVGFTPTAKTAPILPYILLILMLAIRSKGFLGTRED